MADAGVVGEVEHGAGVGDEAAAPVVGRGYGGAGAVDEAVTEAGVGGAQQFVAAAREVGVDGAAGNPRLCGDALDGGVGETCLADDGEHGVDEFFPRALLASLAQRGGRGGGGLHALSVEAEAALVHSEFAFYTLSIVFCRGHPAAPAGRTRMITVDLPVAIELAREALAGYDLDPGTELSLLKQRENFVFSLTSGGTDYVLRVHRQGYHSDDELGCELDFVRALHGEGVAVPHFVPARNGRGFCVVGRDHAAGAHQVDLQHLIPNHGNFGDERTAVAGTAHIDTADFAELGRLTAKVHEATERSGYRMAVPRDDWDLDGLVGPQPAWGDPLRIAELQGEERDAVVAAIARIRDELGAYGTPAHRFGPIHADLTPENVLRTDDGLVLIDFDDFAAGWHLFDLATALYFFTPHPRYAEYRDALFAGYESVRPLDAADSAVFPAILLARGLTYLGWAADRRGEPTAEWHATTVLPHIVRLSRELVAA